MTPAHLWIWTLKLVWNQTLLIYMLSFSEIVNLKNDMWFSFIWDLSLFSSFAKLVLELNQIQFHKNFYFHILHTRKYRQHKSLEKSHTNATKMKNMKDTGWWNLAGIWLPKGKVRSLDNQSFYKVERLKGALMECIWNQYTWALI